MRSSILISALFAATAIALPLSQHGKEYIDEHGNKVVVTTEIVYKYVNEAGQEIRTETVTSGPAPEVDEPLPDNVGKGQPEPIQEAQKPTSPAAEESKPKPTPIPTPESTPESEPAPPTASAPAVEPEPESKPEPTPESTSNGGSDPSSYSSGGDLTPEGMLKTINFWRSKYNKSPLTWNDQLATRAREVSEDNVNAGTMEHNTDGSKYAQVIAGTISSDTYTGTSADNKPLNYSAFEFAFLNGWMCESKKDAQIVNICPVLNKVLPISNIGSDPTGHYKILIDNRYKTVGCGFAKTPGAKISHDGQYTCNLK